jgi:predicted GIY-YIG superfamily endonuclease
MENLTCYCIVSENNNRTYVGATNNFDKRIRQHNRELTGGAKATCGYTWRPLLLITGFDSRNELLSFEWHFKHVKNLNIRGGVNRRLQALEILTQQEKWKKLKILKVG